MSWVPRGPALGGVEGWLAWYDAVARSDGSLRFDFSVPSGSNPRVALNAMRIASTSTDLPETPDVRVDYDVGSGFFITFSTEPGATYTLEQNPDLTNPAGWVAVPGQSVVGDGHEHSLSGPSPGSSSAVFYRIRVSR